MALAVHDVVGFMKALRTAARALALAPLLTACATFAGGNPGDIADPPRAAEEASEPTTDRSASATDNEAGFRERSEPIPSESADSGEFGAGQASNSNADGPLQDVPLVIDLSDLTDEDGLGNLAVQWQEFDESRGRWTKIDGATSQGFTPRQRHVGNQLRVSIEYIDGRGNLESIVTVPTPPVRNVNDPPTGELQLIGTQAQYETLKADISDIRDEDGIGTIRYYWEVSSDGDTWQRYRENEWRGDTVVLSQEEVGRYIRAGIRYTDGFGANEQVTSAATDPIRNVNDPVRGDLMLRGDTRVGETLQADISGISDRDGIANVTLIWESSDDGRTWRRAAESSARQLNLDNRLVDRQIRARAIVVDRFGNEGTVISGNVGPVEAVNSSPAGTIRILSVD